MYAIPLHNSCTYSGSAAESTNIVAELRQFTLHVPVLVDAVLLKPSSDHEKGPRMSMASAMIIHEVILMANLRCGYP